MEKVKLIVTIKFRGIDDFNRPVFKDVNSSSHFGSVHTLYNDMYNKEEINKYFKESISELEYFGERFNCEPHGGINSNIKLIIE